jgi:hypothetical protein
MKYLHLFLFFAVATVAQAQISVSLTIKDRFHLLHEPVMATVNVTNLTGHDIELSDSATNQWFGFRIIGEGDQSVPPRSRDYHLEPLTIKAGGTARRSVNLTELYEIDGLGSYRIQPNIYYVGLDKYFSCKPMYIDVSEGHVIWRQFAGVPEGQPGAGQTREFTLLTHQRGEVNTLYLRVTDKDDGTVYCTYPIGRLLDNSVPQAEFDSSNNIYVLHLTGTRAYLLTKVTANGEFGGQTPYSAPKYKPFLRKNSEGALQIVGAKRDAPALSPENVAVPRLSARPPGFPGN